MFKLDTEKKAKIASFCVKAFFHMQKYMTWCKKYNYPKDQCIFALWHAHQFALFDLKERNKVNIMVSRSKDGDMIAYATESLGFKTVRGSKGKEGAVRATLELLERLKEGEFAAITVDGPRGPKHIVKEGVIKIAQKSGVPIVPMLWHCPQLNFVKFNSWDQFNVPFFICKILVGYGEPIFVEDNRDEQYYEEKRLEVEKALIGLNSKLPNMYRNFYGKNKSIEIPEMRN